MIGRKESENEWLGADLLIVGEIPPPGLHALESEGICKLRFVQAPTLLNGLVMISQYARALDGILVGVSSETSSATLQTFVQQVRSLSPDIPVFVIGDEKVLCTRRELLAMQIHSIPVDAAPSRLIQYMVGVLAAKGGPHLQVARRPRARICVSENPTFALSKGNYMAHFAYRLESVLVPRTLAEEQDAQMLAVRWHFDLLTLLSFLHLHISIAFRFINRPPEGAPSAWLVAEVSACDGRSARVNAERCAIQLEQFLFNHQSDSAAVYKFSPVCKKKGVAWCNQPFLPAAVVEFRHKSVELDWPAESNARSITITSPLKSGMFSVPLRAAYALAAHPFPTMLEIVLRPDTLTVPEMKTLREARNSIWNSESQLTYRELLNASQLLDELLRSAPDLWLSRCRMWSANEDIPESLIAIIAGDCGNEIHNATTLWAQSPCPGPLASGHQDDRFTQLVSKERAANSGGCPLPTTKPFPGIRPHHPIFDFTPPNLPSSGPVLGHKQASGRTTVIRLSQENLRRHVYITGQTGTGKSTLLRSMINERIESGMGLCLIDPHGDLLSGVYTSLTQRDRSRTIVFDPTNVSKPLGLNMLEYDPSHPEQKTLLVNQMISIFDMLYNLHLTGGPIFEQYMRNAMLLVMDDPDHQGTLVSVTRVFQESEYRKDLVDRCKNSLVKAFWHEAMRTRGEAGLEYLTPYITSKLNQFVSNDYIYPIISQKKSGLDFRTLIDSDTILLVKLSKGKLGEIGVKLLGMILFARLLLAALSRDDVQENKRADFCLFVDEFQNFTSESVAQMLSEARKYRLNLVLANQTLGQLRNSILESVLGNVGSLVIFRPGINDCERLKPYLDPPFRKEEVLNLPNYVAIGKLLAQGIPLPPFVFNTIKPPTKYR